MNYDSLIGEIRRKHLARRDGGEGSGNWGHSGRPGKIGGSQENPGSAAKHRYVDAKTKKYTSFAKEKFKAAAPHHAGVEEMQKLPTGSLIVNGKDIYIKQSGTKWQNKYTGEIVGGYTLSKKFDNNVKVAIPGSSEPELKDKVISEGSMIGTKKYGHIPEDKKKEKSAKAPETKAEETDKSAVTEEPKVAEKASVPVPESVSSVSAKGTPYTKKTCPYSESGYDGARVSAAMSYSSYEKDKADEYFAHSKASSDNIDLTDDETSVIERYSDGSKYMSEPLHDIHYYGSKTPEKTLVEDIEDLTNAINKTEIEQDCILYHGLGSNGFRKMFGLDTYESYSNAIGRVGWDESFCSTCIYDNNPLEKPIMMEIFVPKGSKGIYIESLSSYEGLGENEIILQRGNAFKITGVTSSYGTYRVKAELVMQDTEHIKSAGYADWLK